MTFFFLLLIGRFLGFVETPHEAQPNNDTVPVSFVQEVVTQWAVLYIKEVSLPTQVSGTSTHEIEERGVEASVETSNAIGDDSNGS